MRIFLDTNVLLDWLLDRGNLNSLEKIFNEIDLNHIEGFVSAGSLYTLAYVLDKDMKQKGVVKENRVERIRSTVLSILAALNVAVVGFVDILHGTKNEAFGDLEDSFQCQAALASYCDVFLTSNLKDFEKSSLKNLKFLSPNEFVQMYLNG